MAAKARLETPLGAGWGSRGGIAANGLPGPPGRRFGVFGAASAPSWALRGARGSAAVEALSGEFGDVGGLAVGQAVFEADAFRHELAALVAVRFSVGHDGCHDGFQALGFLL